MNQPIFEYAGFGFFYDQFRPVTTYGVRYKAEQTVFNSAAELELEFDLTEKCQQLLTNHTFVADKLKFHLKRIPELPEVGEASLTVAEVYLYKKFLVNFAAIDLLLEKGFKEDFSVDFQLDDLLTLLSPDKTQAETFYISDRYSLVLGELREKIAALNMELKTLRKEKLDVLFENFGFDFRFHDFLVVDKQQTLGLPESELFVEAYDNHSTIVKPVWGHDYLSLVGEKKELILAEQELEQDILKNLSAEIYQVSEEFEKYIDVIRQLDVSLARATMIRPNGLVRPTLVDSGDAALVHGRLLHLQQRCEQLGMKYTPLDWHLKSMVTVLHGSNMCGKTVALQTLTFMQLATQLGFFVPADEFCTTLFDSFSYIGDQSSARQAGLSSFGHEINQVIEVLNRTAGKQFLVMDEFAGTTNSREAVALIAALLEKFCQLPAFQLLLATHYTGLPKLVGLSFFRMTGVDWALFDSAESSIGTTLEENLKALNRCADYSVVEDHDQLGCHDAIRIAEVLGLAPEIADIARGYL